MLSLPKKIAMWVAAIMIVAGLTVSHVCLADISPASGHQISAEKSHSDKHSKSNAADHCCVANHCCVAKVFSNAANVWIAPSIDKMYLALPIMQNPTGHIPQSLERPPKSFI